MEPLADIVAKLLATTAMQAAAPRVGEILRSMTVAATGGAKGVGDSFQTLFAELAGIPGDLKNRLQNQWRRVDAAASSSQMAGLWDSMKGVVSGIVDSTKAAAAAISPSTKEYLDRSTSRPSESIVDRIAQSRPVEKPEVSLPDRIGRPESLPPVAPYGRSESGASSGKQSAENRPVDISVSVPPVAVDLKGLQQTPPVVLSQQASREDAQPSSMAVANAGMFQRLTSVLDIIAYRGVATKAEKAQQPPPKIMVSAVADTVPASISSPAKQPEQQQRPWWEDYAKKDSRGNWVATTTEERQQIELSRSQQQQAVPTPPATNPAPTPIAPPDIFEKLWRKDENGNNRPTTTEEKAEWEQRNRDFWQQQKAIAAEPVVPQRQSLMQRLLGPTPAPEPAVVRPQVPQAVTPAFPPAVSSAIQARPATSPESAAIPNGGLSWMGRVQEWIGDRLSVSIPDEPRSRRDRQQFAPPTEIAAAAPTIQQPPLPEIQPRGSRPASPTPPVQPPRPPEPQRDRGEQRTSGKVFGLLAGIAGNGSAATSNLAGRLGTAALSAAPAVAATVGGMASPAIGASAARVAATGPVGAAVATVVAVVAAFVALPKLLKELGQNLVESNRELSHYNASIAASYALYDQAAFMRRLELADATSGTAGMAANEWSKSLDELAPAIKSLGTMFNLWSTGVALLARAAPQIVTALTGGLVDINGLLEKVQKDIEKMAWENAGKDWGDQLTKHFIGQALPGKNKPKPPVQGLQ